MRFIFPLGGSFRREVGCCFVLTPASSQPVSLPSPALLGLAKVHGGKGAWGRFPVLSTCDTAALTPTCHRPEPGHSAPLVTRWLRSTILPWITACPATTLLLWKRRVDGLGRSASNLYHSGNAEIHTWLPSSKTSVDKLVYLFIPQREEGKGPGCRI